MPAFKHLTSFAAVFLVLYGVFPVMVSAAYGGNPPPHIARLLDKQMEVFATIAPIVFTPFKVFASFEKQPDKKQPSKVILIGDADPALKRREVLRPPSECCFHNSLVTCAEIKTVGAHCGNRFAHILPTRRIFVSWQTESK